MPRLASRQKFVPGGFKFVQPEIKWQAAPNTSFDSIVWGLINARQANPNLLQKYGWRTDYNNVANEVDEYNAALCLAMGWTEYVSAPAGGQVTAAPFPLSPPPSSPSDLSAAAAKVKAIWSGVRILNDWIDSNTPAVPPEQSAARAAVCAVCPKNVAGDFSAWFTKPASEAIRRQLEKVQDRKLSTPHDDKLNVCEVCYCPMKLKVHTPLAYIRQHTTAEVLQGLNAVPGCWISKELNG